MKHNVFEDNCVASITPDGKRKTIFDLYRENNTQERDFERIRTLFESKAYAQFVAGYISLKEMASNAFLSWKQRGRCLSFSDFLVTIRYDNLVANAPHDVNSFLTFIELVYNMLCLCDITVDKNPLLYDFYHDTHIELREMMDEILSEMNQKAYYDPETEQCLIGEDSPQVTAAVEALEPETASQILRYNHRQLAGDIAGKRVVLKNLADYLEGRKDELKSINAQLFTDISSAVNNLNIRHNNLDHRNQNRYKEKLAQMSPEELEKWYDDVYQMILLAILEMDNVERRDHVRTMIQEINQ